MLLDKLLRVPDVSRVHDVGQTFTGVLDAAGGCVDGDASDVRGAPGDGGESVEELGSPVFVGGELEPHAREDGAVGSGVGVEV